MSYIPYKEYSFCGINVTVSKAQRFKEFINRLKNSPLVKSATSAFELISNTLNKVEDEHTNIPYSSKDWMNDGRMYPPQEDSKRETDNPKVTRYRNRSHNTYIGRNGAFKIQEIKGNKSVLVDKKGEDKQKIGDL